MDIQKWLQATTDRAPPDRSDDVNIPDFVNRQPGGRDANARRYHRKTKKRASSDSSVIAPKHDKHQTAPHKRYKWSDDYSKDESSSHDHHLRGVRSSESTSSAAPSKTYERRPRHKTKADRYEPKSKKPRKERVQKKPARKQRRSHRNDGERTTGLVQSFQLKNGPKQNRLTLKHDAGAGLFKHGRASAQMTGRGNGLPDLVFNEMKFLQRPTEHQDELAHDEAPRKEGKHEKQRQDNEDTSAYFTARNVAHDQTDRLDTARRNLKEVASPDHDLQQQRPAGRRSPSIELPDKPFLGFGSKGVHTGSSRGQHNESTEYYSWSESMPRQSNIANEPTEPPPQQEAINRLSPKHTAGVHRLTKRKQGAAEIEEHDEHGNSDAGQWLPSKRARGPHVIEVYQPPPPKKRRKTEGATSITRTTRQSLPRLPSLNLQEIAGVGHQTGYGDKLPSDYRTSDILDIPDVPNLRRNAATKRKANNKTTTVVSDKENADPQSSIDKLLSQARKATEHHHSPMKRPPRLIQEPTRVGSFDRPDIKAEAHQRLHRVPFNQLSAEDRLIVPDRRPQVTMHATDARRFSALRTSRVVEHYPEDLTNRRGRQEFSTEQLSEDEMLDNEPEPQQDPGNQLCATSRQAEDLALRAGPILHSGFYEAQSEALESDSHERTLLRDSVSRHTYPTHVSPIGREILSERLDQSRSVVDEIFAGFWKPNKLY